MKAERFAGVLSIAAALAHGGLTAEHFGEWWGYGLFFLVTTLAQAVLGLALLTDAFEEGGHVLAMLAAGVVGNVLVMGMYVLSRTSGIPVFGPQTGLVEDVDALGVTIFVAEAATALLLALAFAAALRSPRAPRALEGP